MDALLAATGDTWGIPSREFLNAYLIAAVAAVVISLVMRSSYARTCRIDGAVVGQLTPSELGMLAGGDRRAVLAAMAHLRSARLITSTGKPAVGLADDVDHFARVVYERLGYGSPKVDRLQRELEVPLAQMRESLYRRGLLYDDRYRMSCKLAALPVAVVALVGIVRIVAGFGNDRPVGWLIAIVVVLALVGFFVSRAGRRTPRGGAEYRDTVRRNQHLRPSRTSNLNAPGDSAAMSAALFGGAALWLLDPGLGSESGVSNTESSGGSDGGSSGGSDGGGGGCGGGGCGGGGCGG